ncbi:outer membrane beta-barrel protein [Glaciecola sp. SC05]|uniref:outer membrane beta-barrel protein n=1 Tax=Glaciecola sp. SC05 TaxID=1987355 RepID=UPI003527AF82
MNRQFAIVILCLLSFSAHAERNFYGILSAGYVQNEVQDFELDKASYKLGIGYELTPQWYLEAGFQGLGELNASDQFATADSDVAEFSGLYLAALGKARGQYGELFYRLGMMRVDANVQSISNLTCPGDPAVASVGPAICSVDNSLLAGVFGVGFDFYIHHSTMLRFEVEYIKGEQDYTATAAYVGVRLNF